MSRSRRLLVVLSLVALAVELLVAHQRGARFGRDTLVRCRKGHLFATTWIPLVSFKAVRLGPWRFQYCPVGRHWTLVSLVGDDEVSEAERQAALGHHDLRLP